MSLYLIRCSYCEKTTILKRQTNTKQMNKTNKQTNTTNTAQKNKKQKNKQTNKQKTTTNKPNPLNHYLYLSSK